MRFNRSPSCGQVPQFLAVFFFAPKLTLTGKSLARFPLESGVQAGNASWCQVVHRCTSLPLAVKHTVRQFSSSITRQIATTLVHDWRPKGLWAKSYATNKEHRRETDWVQASEDAAPTTL